MAGDLAGLFEKVGLVPWSIGTVITASIGNRPVSSTIRNPVSLKYPCIAYLLVTIFCRILTVSNIVTKPILLGVAARRTETFASELFTLCPESIQLTRVP
jgi:hypothetical protein